MNKVILIGNIAKDIEVKYSKSNKAVVNVSLAVNEGYGENKITSFFEIEAWDKLAENIAKYCEKGSKIIVDGRLKQNKWIGEDGKQKSKMLVSAVSVEFVGSKKENKNEDIKVEQGDDFFGSIDSEDIVVTDDDLPF